MDDVEEGRQAVDVVELARERRGEVEAEAVDVALADPVAQRVHDQAQDARVHRVERIARPGEVHVVARVVRHQPVVRGVVDALEGEHRAEVVPLGGVVVDDVEDHLDARAVQRLHHALELAHLLAAPARRGVQRVRREVADRGVAPVVRQALLVEEALVRDVVDGQELDRRHAQALEVLERPFRCEAAVGAAKVFPYVRVQGREALDVHLVDDRLVPRDARTHVVVVLPVEALVDDDALGHRRRVVDRVALEIRVVSVRDVRQRAPRVEVDRAGDRLRVRVEQELARVEPVALRRRPAAVDAVRVVLPRADARHVPVPVERGPLEQLDALLLPVVVEEAELDALCVLGEEREVRAVAVACRTERERIAGPERAAHSSSSTLGAAKSRTSVALAAGQDHAVSVHADLELTRQCRAQRQELAKEGIRLAMHELRPIEGLARLRVGRVARRPGRPLDLTAAPLARRLGDCGIDVVREEEERVLLLVLLAHEHERRVQREEDAGERDTVSVRREAVAERAVPDLVVVLRAHDETLRLRALQLADEPVHRAEVRVVTGLLAGEQDVELVVQVVEPHRVVSPLFERSQVFVVHLGDHECVDALLELGEHVRLRIVVDRMDGIEPQAVDARSRASTSRRSGSPIPARPAANSRSRSPRTCRGGR